MARVARFAGFAILVTASVGGSELSTQPQVTGAQSASRERINAAKLGAAKAFIEVEGTKAAPSGK